MTRPAFLSSPGVWIRTPRTAQSAADYACSVEHNVQRSPWTLADFIVAAIAVAVIAAIVGGQL